LFSVILNVFIIQTIFSHEQLNESVLVDLISIHPMLDFNVLMFWFANSFVFRVILSCDFIINEFINVSVSFDQLS